jgi:hypothetical protein
MFDVLYFIGVGLGWFSQRSEGVLLCLSKSLSICAWQTWAGAKLCWLQSLGSNGGWYADHSVQKKHTSLVIVAPPGHALSLSLQCQMHAGPDRCSQASPRQQSWLESLPEQRGYPEASGGGGARCVRVCVCARVHARMYAYACVRASGAACIFVLPLCAYATGSSFYTHPCARVPRGWQRPTMGVLFKWPLRHVSSGQHFPSSA